MTKSISKAATEEDDVLVGFARKIGTALGAVAAKLGSEDKPARHTPQKSVRAKPGRARRSTATNKRPATKTRLEARRSKTKR